MIHLGLTGWPVIHSISPKIHNAALEAIGMHGEYRLYPIDPKSPEKLIELMEMVRQEEITGLNVTIPYKQTIMRLVDELTPAAERIGAVNTIYLKNHCLVGHNTDASGFLTDFRKKTDNLPIPPGKAIVLGAGGSARAVVSALLGISWQVLIAARKMDQAGKLMTDFSREGGFESIKCISLDADSILPIINQTNLVVNTTPVGMYPLIEYSPWPCDLWPETAFVYDLIYNPRQTMLIKNALSAGLRAVNGLGMLVEQAALAFDIWTGRTAPLDVMFSAADPGSI